MFSIINELIGPLDWFERYGSIDDNDIPGNETKSGKSPLNISHAFCAGKTLFSEPVDTMDSVEMTEPKKHKMQRKSFTNISVSKDLRFISNKGRLARF